MKPYGGAAISFGHHIYLLRASRESTGHNPQGKAKHADAPAAYK